MMTPPRTSVRVSSRGEYLALANAEKGGARAMRATEQHGHRAARESTGDLQVKSVRDLDVRVTVDDGAIEARRATWRRRRLSSSPLATSSQAWQADLASARPRASNGRAGDAAVVDLMVSVTPPPRWRRACARPATTRSMRAGVTRGRALSMAT
jgi:hypothetical protein